ncbi:MAG TPA: L-threonylcarbamoyladenylate synthase [Desulfobacteraceae bacterium]|nr:L-threonylcarbamoyladenylate synthase [Desulfobacteraceae bacterium]
MDKKGNIVTIDPVNPQEALITRAARLIAQGGVVVFPTKQLYGIAANARCFQAVKRVFHIKQRPLNNPLLVLINEKKDLAQLVTSEPGAARALMKRFWPGDVTIVFTASDDIPGILTAHTGKIGIRMPSHPVARALVKAAGTPMTGTSANISGARGVYRINDLDRSIVQKADLVLDAGPLAGGRGSTVVDVTEDPVKVIRQGEVTVD